MHVLTVRLLFLFSAFCELVLLIEITMTLEIRYKSAFQLVACCFQDLSDGYVSL